MRPGRPALSQLNDQGIEELPRITDHGEIDADIRFLQFLRVDFICDDVCLSRPLTVLEAGLQKAETAAHGEEEIAAGHRQVSGAAACHAGPARIERK